MDKGKYYVHIDEIGKGIEETMDGDSFEINWASRNKKKNRLWIAYAFGATAAFTICNEAISEITSKAGPACIFYFAIGGIISGLTYHLT